MSLFDRLRNLFSGPPRIAGGGDPGAAADLHEEYGTPDAGEADVKRMAGTGMVEPTAEPGLKASFGAAEAAEAAEAELESEEPPADPAP